MVRQVFQELTVRTRGRGLYEITEEVAGQIQQSGMQQGVANLLLRHTSASLVIQENADPEVRRDLERYFARLVRDGDPLFQHTAEGEDDMPAHVRTVLTNVHLSIPFAQGRMWLGTWQGIYVWEHRLAPHARQIALHLLGE